MFNTYHRIKDALSNTKYLTYLHKNVVAWLNFLVNSLRLPTGNFSMHLKERRFSCAFDTPFKMFVKHKMLHENISKYFDILYDCRVHKLSDLHNIATYCWEFNLS